ncbi:MAG TPA: LEPR-XLL domain-containing protein, partial [Steroidobacteraceae bacterium]|nr:LEPR-XLL domain-containing protein [Steroidobacteraceae bacterium]
MKVQQNNGLNQKSDGSSPSTVAAAIRSLLRSGQVRQQQRHNKVKPAPARRVHFESLEPRVLMSANPVLVTGSLDAPGETDTYTFTLDTNSHIVFDSLTNNSNINWTLNGPHGEKITSHNFANSDSSSISGTPVLDLSAGDYTLTVDGVGATTGSYGFRLINLADAPVIMPDNPLLNESLNPASETNAYRFNASAGDQYYFDFANLVTTGGSRYVHWRLLDPTGRTVFGPNQVNDPAVYGNSNNDVGPLSLN